MATIEGADLLGSLQTSWSWLVGVGLSDEAEEFARLKFARWQWFHTILQQRGAAEAGDVKFAVDCAGGLQ